MSRTTKQALHVLVLVKETLGDEWLTPDRFRIGASSVLNDLLMQYDQARRPAATGGPRTSRRSERDEPPPHPTRTALRWDYAPAPEATDHVRLRDRYGLFVDGASSSPRTARYAPTINPATEEPLAEVALGRAGRRRRAPSRRRARRCPRWRRCPRSSAASTSSASRA